MRRSKTNIGYCLARLPYSLSLESCCLFVFTVCSLRLFLLCNACVCHAINKNNLLTYLIYSLCWLRGPAIEHWSLADVLSLSCTRLVADG